MWVAAIVGAAAVIAAVFLAIPAVRASSFRLRSSKLQSAWSFASSLTISARRSRLLPHASSKKQSVPFHLLFRQPHQISHLLRKIGIS